MRIIKRGNTYHTLQTVEKKRLFKRYWAEEQTQVTKRDALKLARENNITIQG